MSESVRPAGRRWRSAAALFLAALAGAGPSPFGESPIEAIRADLGRGAYAGAAREARSLLAELRVSSEPDPLSEAALLDLLVEALTRGGLAMDPDASTAAKRAVALRESIPGPASIAFSLRNLSRLLCKRGDYEGARRAAERALEITERELGAWHPETAASLNDLGLALRELGDLAAARERLERALAIRETALGPEHLLTADTRDGLGSVLVRLGGFDAARREIDRAIAIREREVGTHHPLVAVSLDNLARLQREAGEFAAAAATYERAILIEEAALGAENVETASTLLGLGITVKNLGDVARARALYDRVLAIYQRVYGPDHHMVAVPLNNIGNLEEEIGDADSARRHHERALAIREKQLGPEHPVTAVTLNNLGNALLRPGEVGKARSYFEQALAVNEKVYGADHYVVGIGLLNLGNLLSDSGDQPGARPYYERALPILTKKLGPEHPTVASCLVGYGDVLMLMRDFEAARPVRMKTLEIRLKVFGPEHLKVAESLYRLAAMHWKMGEEEAALDRALEAEAMARRLLQNAARGLSHRETLLFEAVRASGLDVAASLIAADAAGRPLEGRVARVWDQVIRSRALVLGEMADRRREWLQAPSAEGRKNAEALDASIGRLARILVKGPDPKKPGTYASEVLAALADKERTERELAGLSGSFDETRARGQAGLAEVRGALPPGGALVAYLLFDRVKQPVRAPQDGAVDSPFADPAYLALVLPVGGGEPLAVDLGQAGPIDAAIHAWREQVGVPPPAFAAASRAREDAAREAGLALRRRLWDPVASRLAGARFVFVVPDGALHLVNLAALPASDRRYLAEEGPSFHYLAAERDLVRSSRTLRETEGVLVVGAPDFDAVRSGSDRVAPASMVKPRSSRLRRNAGVGGCSSPVPERFDPIPQALKEVEEIERLWRSQNRIDDGAMDPVIRLSGGGATESAFKRAAPGRRILHVATHGFVSDASCVREDAPATRTGAVGLRGTWVPQGRSLREDLLALSGLAFAGANAHADPDKGAAEDGILTSEEIASLDLSGMEWAVLSGCETGLGGVMAGEGVLGLRRAFQTAGVQTLIMTLWPVDDRTTRAWMRELYGGRLAGLSTVESMRRASVEYLRRARADGRSTHPSLWGSFVAVGDWR